MKLFGKKIPVYPDFWKRYEDSFLIELPADLDQIRFVVLDTETTGLDVNKDRILCIGALTLQNNIIRVNETLEIYIKQEYYQADSAQIHGIIKNEKKPCFTELEALIKLLDYLENAVLVAHHANFDTAIINKALNRHGLPALKNTVLDTGVLYKRTLIDSPLLERKSHYTLDDLALKFNISKKDRHTALGDAFITAIAFLRIINDLEGKNKLQLKEIK